METSSESETRRKPARNRSGVILLVRLAAVIVFVLGIYLSIRLGISMAKNRLPQVIDRVQPAEETETMTLGRNGAPTYLADDPDSLRKFFSDFASPGERASADLTGRSIRRITSPLEMTTLHVEADSIEVRITSGAIAGAVYWIHHSQMPDPTASDPILSPVPTANE